MEGSTLEEQECEGASSWDDESLSSAIRFTQELRSEQQEVDTTHRPTQSTGVNKRCYKQSAYFSDEEDLE